MKNKVIARVAPSPTGPFHLGTARTALFNYLFVKKTGGQLLLRIDDTDGERSRDEYEQNIREGLEWLGLKFDADYKQSERTEIYKQELEKLIASGQAYISQEEIKEAGQRSEVIRLKNAGEDVTFVDLIRGEITFNTAELGDFVIAKDLTNPLYHFASVVDDKELGVNHIMRGDDHLSNTARQILIGQAIGAKTPKFAHIPLILAPDRSKLSKRHGATGLLAYRDLGYLSETMINFLALLGWSPQAKGGAEANDVLSLPEIIELFELADVQKSGAVFDVEKLNSLNREYLKKLTPELAAGWLALGLTDKTKNLAGYNEETLANIAPVILERVSNYDELRGAEGADEVKFWFEAPTPDQALLKTTEHLPKLAELLEEVNESDWTTENIKNAVWDFATETGRGEVLWPMRVALTGLAKSPDPFLVAEKLGKKETLNRLSKF
ncbi:MAG: glutamate--tRNA ligase [Candidatus Vogelbacteria bacterium CG10_big_fil_rev_8_21_14_0_10_50_13]|uniref:Glutamate--tRNA ligase n=1 Tax=Candidatus Vogelbacteria bacterium CG10_big_fil_rev_8_21_14_0_10_50_13 TaxID=1975044 RepID=A0A2H0RGG2_9BACT|nr:MAG: glutamate--tRNA ligase [Candidatus Vogelbacteria bacterium CG10_big_fil_rev_8_21_14_0_10_50_13]